MSKNLSHTECAHENTKSARAACRRQRLTDATDRVVTETFALVRGARQQGYANTIKEITFYEVAQKIGVLSFDLEQAKDLALEKARLMGEWDLLDESVRPVKEVR